MTALGALLISVFLPFTLMTRMPQEMATNMTLMHSFWTLPTPSVWPTLPPIKPTFTPTPTSIPQSTVTPTPTSIPTPTLQPTTIPTPLQSIRDYLMQEINNYRHSQGLSSVQTDSYTCNFAEIRAREIVNNFNHNGFTNRINSKTLPYPSYSLVVENLAMTGNFKDVIRMWINSPGHATNLKAKTSYGCTGNSGSYYTYEGWNP